VVPSAAGACSACGRARQESECRRTVPPPSWKPLRALESVVRRSSYGSCLWCGLSTARRRHSGLGLVTTATSGRRQGRLSSCAWPQITGPPVPASRREERHGRSQCAALELSRLARAPVASSLQRRGGHATLALARGAPARPCCEVRERRGVRTSPRSGGVVPPATQAPAQAAALRRIERRIDGTESWWPAFLLTGDGSVNTRCTCARCRPRSMRGRSGRFVLLPEIALTPQTASPLPPPLRRRGGTATRSSVPASARRVARLRRVLGARVIVPRSASSRRFGTLAMSVITRSTTRSYSRGATLRFDSRPRPEAGGGAGRVAVLFRRAAPRAAREARKARADRVVGADRRAAACRRSGCVASRWLCGSTPTRARDALDRVRHWLEAIVMLKPGSVPRTSSAGRSWRPRCGAVPSATVTLVLPPCRGADLVPHCGHSRACPESARTADPIGGAARDLH